MKKLPTELNEIGAFVLIQETLRLIQEDTGFKFSTKQEKSLFKMLISGNDNDFQLKLSRRQKKFFNSQPDADDIQLDEYMEKILGGERGNFSDLLTKRILTINQKEFKEWVTKSNKKRRQNRKGYREVFANISKMYGEPISKFRDLLQMGIEINSMIFDEVAAGEREVISSNFFYVALHRLHLQSQRVSREVIVLIENGYSDGAMARWRTLHEYSVIAGFLEKNGEEAAERYLDYRIVEIFKDAKWQCEAKNPFDFVFATEDDVANLDRTVKELEEKYGKDFSSSFGWAKPYISKKRVTLMDLEKEVNLDFYRPVVNMSHHTVHGGSQSLFFQLGQPPYAPNSIITGPSAYGILDPLQYSIRSYYSIAVQLFTQMNSVSIAKYLSPFGDLYDEAIKSIDKVFTKYFNT